MSSLKGILFSIILIVVAFFGLFFLPLCLLLYFLPFCGELARTANDLLISLWLKLVPVLIILGVALHNSSIVCISPLYRLSLVGFLV